MSFIAVCSECKGHGNLEIRNAYDPSSVEYVICDYCNGEGTASDIDEDEDGPLYHKHAGRDWIN